MAARVALSRSNGFRARRPKFRPHESHSELTSALRIISDHFALTVPSMPFVRATSEFRSRLTGVSRFPKSEP
jgi:hypothetical protein